MGAGEPTNFRRGRQTNELSKGKKCRIENAETRLVNKFPDQGDGDHAGDGGHKVTGAKEGVEALSCVNHQSDQQAEGCAKDNVTNGEVKRIAQGFPKQPVFEEGFLIIAQTKKFLFQAQRLPVVKTVDKSINEGKNRPHTEENNR